MGDRRQRLEVRVIRQLLLALALLALVLVQTHLLPHTQGALFNLLLVGVVCKTALSGLGSGALWGFYGGIWLDLLSSSAVGANALALLLTAALSAWIVRAFDPDNLLMPLALVAGGTLVFQLWRILSLGGAGDWGSYALIVLVPALILNLIAALPVYMLLRWWERRRNPRLEW